MRDDLLFFILLALIALVVGVVLFLGIRSDKKDAEFSERCMSAGGTPIMHNGNRYCVEKFADMSNGA